MVPLFLLLSSWLVSQAHATCQPTSTAAFSHPPITASGLQATLIYKNLTTPRDIKFDILGNLLVVERGVGVSIFYPRNDSSCVGWERGLLVNDTSLTNGIELSNGRLFVSSMKQVILWQYNPVSKNVSGSPRVIVDNLPSDGELPARTLLFSPETSYLYVSIGPLTNIDSTAADPSSGRSQIRRFQYPLVQAPFKWTGLGSELVAYGIRNAAGLAFSPGNTASTLWAVENGASLNEIIGSNGSTDNPADELERINLAPASLGKFYGFPYCHTSYAPLPAPWNVTNPGDQFSINGTSPYNNTYCQKHSNNNPPALLFQPHSVPLDVKFYTSPAVIWPAIPRTALPSTWYNDAFVSFHGSFDRIPPTGYGVVRIPWTKTANGGPVASSTSKTGYEFLVQAANLTSCPGSCIRPVGLAFEPVLPSTARGGRLFVSSDTTGEAC